MYEPSRNGVRVFVDPDTTIWTPSIGAPSSGTKVSPLVRTNTPRVDIYGNTFDIGDFSLGANEHIGLALPFEVNERKDYL